MGDFLVSLGAILLVLVAFVGGVVFGVGEVQKEAVKQEVGEYYLNEHGDKGFRFIQTECKEAQ